MEEFSALAARVAASVGALRGCLILSRSGLVLGAFPQGQEGLVKPAWLKFASMGEPEKSFVEFGDEIWAYVRRGPYAAFAVSAQGVRPGLIIDHLEQMLYSAEEIRAKREAFHVPEVSPAPTHKPRSSLHPGARPPAAAPSGPRPAPAEREAGPAPSEGPAPARRAQEEGEEIDRVLLAQEFSRLLQEGGDSDENNEAT